MVRVRLPPTLKTGLLLLANIDCRLHQWGKVLRRQYSIRRTGLLLYQSILKLLGASSVVDLFGKQGIGIRIRLCRRAFLATKSTSSVLKTIYPFHNVLGYHAYPSSIFVGSREVVRPPIARHRFRSSACALVVRYPALGSIWIGVRFGRLRSSPGVATRSISGPSMANPGLRPNILPR